MSKKMLLRGRRGGNGRRGRERQGASGRALLRREGGATVEEGTADEFHGGGRPAGPPPSGPQPPTMQGRGTARVSAGQGRGRTQPAWFSGRIRRPDSLHQYVRPMREGEGPPRSQAMRTVSPGTEGGRTPVLLQVGRGRQMSRRDINRLGPSPGAVWRGPNSLGYLSHRTDDER